MNNDRIAGNWKQFKGKLKEQWGKLTDDDLDVIQGRREQLLGRIQERHGIKKEEAEQQVTEWHKRNPDFFFEKS
ncbi:CsbD family protein [Xylophilus sp. ASV27]|uniref:CsbD family protein n=1 Tax=Xylophilus sp. ASV27 TaxID=2795129 RepID=UPI0018EB3533|nr:CsbD family protein [Xylophilus sp. ASV27]